MDKKLNAQHKQARQIRKDTPLKSTFIAATSVIETCLGTLNTADKNRLLLALHAQIGNQLEALTETIHD